MRRILAKFTQLGITSMSSEPHERVAEEKSALANPGPGHDSQTIQQARQVLGCFNHRCRNSLNGIKMGLYLFKRQTSGPLHQCWAELAQSYADIERLFDRLQLIYRPMSVNTVRSPFGLLVNERLPAWTSSLSTRGQTLSINPPEKDDPGDFDPMYLGLGLDSFVAWRAAAGRPTGQSTLSWRIADRCFEISWDELGSANRSARGQPELGLSQGARQSSRVDTLALPLLARVVAAHGGFVETLSDPAFGIKLRWPQFQSSNAPN
jgi:hypothetical protein